MKDRYFRSQERKRLREQKQERERNHRELEQQLEKCERNELINVPTSTSSTSTDALSDNRLGDNNKQEREETSGYNSEDEYFEHPSAQLSEEEWRRVMDLVDAEFLYWEGGEAYFLNIFLRIIPLL